MKKTLFGFIWRYSKRQQIFIVLITVLSFPLVYASLELPKLIVNDALQSSKFPREVWGYELGQIHYLVLLCCGFLGLVVLNNGVKLVLNIYKGLVGERMLRRLRAQLFFQIVRFRPTHFRKVSSGELIPMLTAEVEDLGGFIGDSIAVPAFQGGTLLVYIIFIFMQDPLLGLASVALYPVQGFVIPRMQRKVIRLSRERIKNIRRLSDRIGESVAGTVDMHANATSAWHIANISDRLYENFVIRFEIYKRKYLIKFVNNFLNQLPPFFFYLIGGILVINGEMSFGALVAVLAAYKDLAAPWLELLNYYQDMANVSVKYQTIVENFDPPEIYSEQRLERDADESRDVLTGPVEIVNATGGANPSNPEVRDVSLRVPEGAHVAVIGDDASGRLELLQMVVGLMMPAAGRVEIGGRDLSQVPEAVLGRSIAYSPASPYIFNTSIHANVSYGLRHRPLGPAELPADEVARRLAEAKATASTLDEFNAPWDDYDRAGLADSEALEAEMITLLENLGLREDLYRVGLQARIATAHAGAFVESILSARQVIRDRIDGDRVLRDLVELWSPVRFNDSATLAENVLFALPDDPATPVGAIPHDPDVAAFLERADLAEDLTRYGLSVAATMVELFSTMRDDDAFVGAYSILSADELPAFEARLKKVKGEDLRALTALDRNDLIGLAFRVVPARHRIADLPSGLVTRIVAARELFREEVLPHTGGRYVPFDPAVYIASLSIEDNLLFGKVRLDRQGAREKVATFVRDTVADIGLRGPVMRAGLEFEVGVAGSRLTASQRRRLGIARALIKAVPLVVLDSVADDPQAIEFVRRRCSGRTLILGVEPGSVPPGLDLYVRMSEGRLVDSGSYATLIGEEAAVTAGPAAMAADEDTAVRSLAEPARSREADA
ncbi:ABC transporter transmembrane domain-containing protein [Pseudoxanthobacter sp.]|uniref:ABC transporter transmembrane domain-containing protein n=1 Tax=Pseudoxanthobacter sp. TaxID=1925742 RepID=UPI002FE3CBAC